ncbi:MAG: PspC domain-containing protein [Candidatus Saccharimonadales bacterium]
MKRVVQVSLGGRAYQVEEAGYERLQAYLGQAEKSLKTNPDKADILADIEESIANKCQASLVAGKNVVSAAVVAAALEKVGPVEADGVPDTSEAGGQEGSEQARKLYTLPKEGKLAGVCAGLALYFNVDVALMRLLFVLLLFITQGFMILVYIAMAFAIPEAKTPEQIAEAHGRGTTAQEIIDRVKQTASNNRDVATKIGTVVTLVGHIVAKVCVIGLAVAFGAVTIAWVWGLWAIGLDTLRLSGELASLNGWKQVVFISAVYVVVALPIFAMIRWLDHIGKDRAEDSTVRTNVATGTLLSVFVLAAVTLSVFFTTYTPSVRQYVDNNKGYLDIGRHHFCVDNTKCGALVEYLKAHPEAWAENPQIDRKYLQN